MLAKGMQPDYYSFKSMIRCVRDCGFGTIESMQQLFQEILKKSPLLIEERSKYFSSLSTPTASGSRESNPFVNGPQSIESDRTNPFASSPDVSTSLVQSSVDASELTTERDQESSSALTMPNLLSAEPTLGSLISLSEVQKPHERFILLGGLSGFLEQMKQRNITPDIEMFTSLLEVIPPTRTAEKQLLMYVRRIGLKADIDFFNILIKQRSMRFDYEGGKEVLTMIHTAGLSPDIVTYGVLALGCQTAAEARELLLQMNNEDIR